MCYFFRIYLFRLGSNRQRLRTTYFGQIDRYWAFRLCVRFGCLQQLHFGRWQIPSWFPWFYFRVFQSSILCAIAWATLFWFYWRHDLLILLSFSCDVVVYYYNLFVFVGLKSEQLPTNSFVIDVLCDTEHCRRVFWSGRYNSAIQQKIGVYFGNEKSVFNKNPKLCPNEWHIPPKIGPIWASEEKNSYAKFQFWFFYLFYKMKTLLRNQSDRFCADQFFRRI